MSTFQANVVTDAADPRVAIAHDNDDWLKIEDTAEWLETIVPQSRLDAYPVYVLCRELLRKVMQREVEYHDARNVALSDLVAQLRAEVAEKEVAMERAARVAQLREQEAQANHRREAEAAAAEQTRLKGALDAALCEVESLQERLALAEQAKIDAEALAKHEEHRADRLEKMGKKAGEEAAVRCTDIPEQDCMYKSRVHRLIFIHFLSQAKIDALQSIVSDATQLRNAMRRIAVDGARVQNT